MRAQRRFSLQQARHRAVQTINKPGSDDTEHSQVKISVQPQTQGRQSKAQASNVIADGISGVSETSPPDPVFFCFGQRLVQISHLAQPVII